MYLHTSLPNNLQTEDLLQQKMVPCLCRISTLFEVLFQEPLPKGSGIVHGWDWAQITERSPALVGGPYMQYAFGLISLRKISTDVYQIVDLSFFVEFVGWCAILKDGELAPPRDFSGEEYFDSEGDQW